jgi:hypothetical protein
MGACSLENVLVRYDYRNEKKVFLSFATTA